MVLRKGTAAAHYVMGGPTANRHNALTLGVATTEIYVMHGETAAAASFSRRLVKEKEAGRPLQPVIDKMNQMAQDYHDNSRPDYCARKGFVDEVVDMSEIRQLSDRLCRRRLPESQIHLPPAPDADAARDQRVAVKAAERGQWVDGHGKAHAGQIADLVDQGL